MDIGLIVSIIGLAFTLIGLGIKFGRYCMSVSDRLARLEAEISHLQKDLARYDSLRIEARLIRLETQIIGVNSAKTDVAEFTEDILTFSTSDIIKNLRSDKE